MRLMVREPRDVTHLLYKVWSSPPQSRWLLGSLRNDGKLEPLVTIGANYRMATDF